MWYEPTSDIVFIGGILASTSGEIDDSLDLILVKDLSELPLVAKWEKDLLDADIWKTVEEVFDLGGRAVELEAHIDQALCNRLHLRLGNVTTDENARALRR